MKHTEQLRGLAFLHPVPIEVESAASIRQFALADLQGPELKRAKSIYVALGLLPADVDLNDLLAAVFEEQVLGYYDLDRDRLVIREDILQGLAAQSANMQQVAARHVIIHELVHALQAQHYDLRERFAAELPIDTQNAYRSVVEGDATLVAVADRLQQAGRLTAGRRIPKQRLREVLAAMAQAANDSPELNRAPPILRETLLSAYVDGLRYAANVYGRGGFRAIDALYQALPETMEHILHPRAEKTMIPPPRIPEFPALQDLHYSPIVQETLGELETRVFLAESTTQTAAARAAAGWDGDRVQVLRAPDGQLSAVWVLRWDRVADAIEAEKLARATLRRSAAGPEGGPLSHGCQRRGKYLAIVRGLPRDLVGQVLTAALTAQLDRPASPH